MTKTTRDILRHHLKRVYFNGSTDTIARQNGVIPNDTKLGETQIEVELDQALNELEAIHQQEIVKARIDEWDRLRVQFISSHWERLRSETNSWAKYVDRRIAELSQTLLYGKDEK